MNHRLMARVAGLLLIVLALALLVPIAISLWFADGQWPVFLSSAMVAGFIGLLLRSTRATDELTHREGFAIVVTAWTLFGVFGALPYLFSGTLGSVVDALFESISGFTTTGSSVLTDVSAVAPSLLFWRSMTHWLGGMGIIVLSLAIMPFLGVAGMQLYKAEVSGPTKERLLPRIEDTARLLWMIYVALTVAEAFLLAMGEMDWFDAVNHAMATVATGGFSTRSGGPAEFQSVYTRVILTIFMFLAGVNFALHYTALLRRDIRVFLRSDEFRFFCWTLVGAGVVATIATYPLYDNLVEASTRAFATVTSIATCTGFTFEDFDQWPQWLQLGLLCLMIMGGMAGSTAGGMKVVRVLVIFRYAGIQVYRLVHPRAVRVLKLDGRHVGEDVVGAILGFGAIYSATALIGTLIITASGLDLTTAASSVLTAMGGVGPGLGAVGPTDNFAAIPVVAKWTMIACMLLGRLELYSVLVLFLPSFWRK
ncbi:MAG: TrkH family potassium uptake protein [Candidatus Dadabacteria bacterium]|nr:MAG: TrkH family potassium uptake protein [Candidatus Dadabacteria bacterium]